MQRLVPNYTFPLPSFFFVENKVTKVCICKFILYVTRIEWLTLFFLLPFSQGAADFHSKFSDLFSLFFWRRRISRKTLKD